MHSTHIPKDKPSINIIHEHENEDDVNEWTDYELE